VKLPSAKALIDAFGGALFVPVGDDHRAAISGWGWSDDAPTSCSLRFTRESGGQIEISARASGGTPDGMLVHRLLFRSVGMGKPAFPLEVRIERDKLRVRIDGRSRVFTSLSSGSRVIAFATVSGVAVDIEGERADLEGLVLRRLAKKEVKALVRAKRAEHAQLHKRRKRRS
jgi:hypothetical protein